MRTMGIISQRDLIRAVPRRWREQYERLGDITPTFSARNGYAPPQKSKSQIADELDQIDTETATPEQIASIIGNSSWTSLQCDQCGKEVASLMTLGRGCDYGSNTARICPSCIARAYHTYQGYPKP